MAAKQGTLVVKFGGSCLTHKGQFETFNEEGLAAAVNCVVQAHQSFQHVIVIHGAGSFGHFQVGKLSSSRHK